MNTIFEGFNFQIVGLMEYQEKSLPTIKSQLEERHRPAESELGGTFGGPMRR
jgi:hypothetical protein